jgi:hypothetical protein
MTRPTYPSLTFWLFVGAAIAWAFVLGALFGYFVAKEATDQKSRSSAFFRLFPIFPLIKDLKDLRSKVI